MAVTWKQLAFTTSALTPTSVDLNAGTLRLPSANSDPDSTEAHIKWQSTLKRLNLYDGTRVRSVSPSGFTPFATLMGWGPGSQYLDSLTLSTVSGSNGGAIAMPIVLTAHMLLQSCIIRQMDTSLARTAEWRLYEDRVDGSNSLNEIANANGTWSFTPTAASWQSSNAASTPVYLPAGCYWLVVRNTSSSRALTLGASILATAMFYAHQAKAIPALGSTLDFVAATWTKSYTVAGAGLQGRVFGQSTAW